MVESGSGNGQSGRAIPGQGAGMGQTREVGHDIIVVGASAGGVEALASLVRVLPSDLPAAVFVVLHLPANANSMLPGILTRAGSLPATNPVNDERIEPGRIYVAPPDHHLLVRDGRVGLSRGPRENRHRPAVDPLFRSAARHYGPRVVSVVLSGTLDDGTAGSAAVRRRGGVTVVQDPDEALFPAMALNAMASGPIDHVLPVAGIGKLLGRLAHEPVGGTAPDVPWEMEREVEMAEGNLAAMSGDDHPGTPSGFGCPDCGGVLWELRDDNVLRFRCRVGHAYSSGSLLEEQGEVLEEALWSALRALEEQAALARRLADRSRDRNQPTMAERFTGQERDAMERASVIQRVLANGPARLSGAALSAAGT